MAEKLRRHADGVARTFVDLFVKEIWEPFDEAGPARAGLAADPRGARADAAARLAQGLLAVFQIAMAEATEKASERTLRARGGQARSQKAEKARQTARVAEAAGA